jgi:DNA-binding IclR family transcriptional regulator
MREWLLARRGLEPPDPSSPPPRGKENTGPRLVDRAAAILLSYSFGQPLLTLAQLAQAAKLPKPTAYRIVSALVANGLMRQTEDGRYELGFRLFELGSIVQSRLVLASLAEGAVQTLADETGETVLLAQAEWSSNELVIVAKIDAIHPVGVLSPLGRRSPIALGCLGKAVLAGLPDHLRKDVLGKLPIRRHTERTLVNLRALKGDLDETHERGYALEEGEYLIGVSGVAAPIHLGDPRPLGAIGVVGPTQRLDAQRLHQMGARVSEVARALSFARPA